MTVHPRHPAGDGQGLREPWSRRAFLRGLLTTGGALLTGAGFARPVDRRVRVALWEPSHGLGNGARLGAEEAARTGALLGWEVELLVVRELAEMAELARSTRVSALLGGFDPDGCRMLNGLASGEGRLFLNLACTLDALRGAECGPFTFHVEASETMYASAAREAGGDAVLWHPTLERYGAEQLNQRFRTRFDATMGARDWAGWMAVKILWEATLRVADAAPEALRRYLRREDTRFDGHKGWPLSFRREDHQLRQPLYVAGADSRLTEVPAREGDASSRDQLDRLASGSGACASLQELP
jgi:hypothetical protein